MSTEICTETKRMHTTSVSVSKCPPTFLVNFTITSGEKYGLVKVMERAFTSNQLIKEVTKYYNNLNNEIKP